MWISKYYLYKNISIYKLFLFIYIKYFLKEIYIILFDINLIIIIINMMQNTIFRTKENTFKKTRARVLARGKVPKSMICGTKKIQKTRFLTRGKAPKSTFLNAKKNIKNNNFIYTRKIPKSTI